MTDLLFLERVEIIILFTLTVYHLSLVYFKAISDISASEFYNLNFST